MNSHKINLEENMLLDLNKFIHHNCKMYAYHMKHINLVKNYALIINTRLGSPLSPRKLVYAALAHDILKERSLDPSKHRVWRGHEIPQDTNRYVRSNLDVLEKYGLDDYFNSSVQYHSLAAGIFLIKELHMKDKEILYAVMFHSCPIIPIYETLDSKTRTMVDVIMLADKLSSNYLRINYRETEVRIDLDQVVFGSNGREFSYSLGLYLARLLGQGKCEEEQGLLSTEYYYKRLCETNPIISENCTIKTLGGSKIWEKRKSQVWTMHY